MRSRLLVRHFLWRFLEHDLVSPNADRYSILSAAGGALIAVSLFLSVLVAFQYWFFGSMPPGMASLASLEDRFLFVSASMLVMALAAVAQWDALVLDPRDTAALGVLPIPRAMIVRAKFVATAIFAAAVVVAWNLFPTLFRAASLPIGLSIGAAGAARLTLAHIVVTVAAGVFGFLAILGLREVVFAILGAGWFRKVSAVLQAALIVGLTTTLLLLPGRSSGVVERSLAEGVAAARMLPAWWFVGLHETLAGSVIDSLPRQTLPPFLARPERAATDLYRAGWPIYQELARIAVVALLLVAMVTVVACLWNNRRLPAWDGRAATRSSVARLASNWIVVHLLATTSLRQAGFFFTLQTLSRQISHRIAVATALALGLALAVIAAGDQRATGTNGPGSIPVAVLAAQFLLIGSLLIGFRRSTRIPAELRASSGFSLAWPGNAGPFISGVKRAGWMAIVLPALLGFGIWHTAILGAGLASLHFGVGVAHSVLFMETLFVRDQRVPFVNGDVSGVDVKLRIFGCAAALLVTSFALAWVERWSFGTSAGYVTLLGALVVLSSSLVLFDHASSRPGVTLDLDEQPPLPTQRLTLAE